MLFNNHLNLRKKNRQTVKKTYIKINVAYAISSFILSSQELQDPVTCLR